MSEIGPITGSRKVTRKGFIIYEVAVSHSHLGYKEIIRGEFPLVLEKKAREKAEYWDALWEKQREKQYKRTAEPTTSESLRGVDGPRLELGTSN